MNLHLPIGTTEKMQNLIFQSRPELKGEIYIAYCPERVLPGNVMYELVYNDRVIGGVDEFQPKKQYHFIVSMLKENYTQLMRVQLKCVSW